jgi:predicted RNase H-like nuclease (RuvC/YqgF family)
MKAEIFENEEKELHSQLTSLDGMINQAHQEMDQMQARLNGMYQERERVIGGLGTIESMKKKLKETGDGK